MHALSVVSEYVELIRRFGPTDGMRFIGRTMRGRPETIRVPDPTVEFVAVNEYALRYHALNSTDKIANLVDAIPLDISSVDRIVDIGANVGLFTLLAREAYPDATIQAVEPHPKALDALRENTRDDAAIEIVPAAVVSGADERETVELQVFDNSSQVSALATHAGNEAYDIHPVKVPATTLPEIVDGAESIDVLKLDIQGGEYDVLAECDDILARTTVAIVEATFMDDSTPELLELLNQHFDDYRPINPVNLGADLLFY